jgi:hypothetical protein
LSELTGEAFGRDDRDLSARGQTLSLTILQVPVKDVAASDLLIEEFLSVSGIDLKMHLHNGRRRGNTHSLSGSSGGDR